MKPVTVKAILTLYKGTTKRKTPIISGYRPHFKFSSMRTSGSIKICNAERVYPGEQAIVYVTFINEEWLGGPIAAGATSFFYESREPLGEVVIIEE